MLIKRRVQEETILRTKKTLKKFSFMITIFKIIVEEDLTLSCEFPLASRKRHANSQ